MGSAKDILLKPISATDARSFVMSHHYSGKVANNSRIHIGVFYQGKLEGAMQFGPPTDIRRTKGLVAGTEWNNFCELNRMVFTDVLPRNSESRALSIALRILRKHAVHLQWVVSFADGTQCGDGTIYRAAGFVLTAIKPNDRMVEMPDGEVLHKIVFADGHYGATTAKKKYGKPAGKSEGEWLKQIGARPLHGYQLRYIYFLDPTARERLTVPILPFSEIERRGARMYKGQALRAGSTVASASAIQAGEGGAEPTPALHTEHYGTQE